MGLVLDNAVVSKQTTKTGGPPVLDACCGSRMMWIDKQNELVLFADLRSESYSVKPMRGLLSGGVINVRPDVNTNFTALPFADESFWHVVFDPPHITRKELLGVVTQKYGALSDGWERTIACGFRECLRVLRPGGTLIFKWCEVEIPLAKVLALAPQAPLYGHKSGKKAQTHWVAFLKTNTISAD